MAFIKDSVGSIGSGKVRIWIRILYFFQKHAITSFFKYICIIIWNEAPKKKHSGYSQLTVLITRKVYICYHFYKVTYLLSGYEVFVERTWPLLNNYLLCFTMSDWLYESLKIVFICFSTILKLKQLDVFIDAFLMCHPRCQVWLCPADLQSWKLLSSLN